MIIKQIVTSTFPDRTQDIKDAVRKAAYEVLAEKVNIKSLKIAQRVKLLKTGLNDRSALVKKACSERLLKAWLMDLGNEIPSLLKRLHVESSQGTPVLALKALFESKFFIPKLYIVLRLINFDNWP